MRKRRSIKVLVARFERPKTNLILRILRWWQICISTPAEGFRILDSNEFFKTWLLRVLYWRHRWRWRREGSRWQAGRRSRTPAPAIIQMFSCGVYHRISSAGLSPQIWWGRTRVHRGAQRRKSGRCPGYWLISISLSILMILFQR